MLRLGNGIALIQMSGLLFDLLVNYGAPFRRSGVVPRGGRDRGWGF
jgi:hypothetical protein